MDGRPRRYAWLAILAAALVVRLAAGVWWQSRLPETTQFAFGDSETYWYLARTIATGEPFQYGEGARIFRTPGYPLILAPLFLAFGNDPPVLAARAVSALLGTASVAGVMGLARTLFDERVALLTGVTTAFEPGAITLGVFVLSEAPFCPLMVLNLWAWTLAWRSPDRQGMLMHAAWGGVAAALATLMRPSWLLFVPFAAILGIAFLVANRKRVSGSDSQRVLHPVTVTPTPTRSSHLAISVTMVLALAITMAPWWIRNYTITGRFIPTTLQVGASLYDGLSPIADGSSNMEFVPGFVAEQQAADKAASSPPLDTFEERLDRRMRDASLAWARENPGRVLQLVGIKLLRMWSPWPNAADLGSFPAKLAIAVGYLPLIVLGLIGAWRYAGRDWSVALLLAPAIYFTLLHVVFVSSLRYRQPAMLLIAILAAAAMVELFDRRRRNSLAGPGLN